jgi:integrase
MAKVTLSYVQMYRPGPGRAAVAYYRRDGLRHRIRGEIGSPEWLAAYQAIHARHERPAPDAPHPRSLAALIAAYRASPEYLTEIKPSTRADYEKMLPRLRDMHGTALVHELDRPRVRAVRDRFAWEVTVAPDGTETRRPTPARANKAVAVLSVLMRHAVELGWRPDNPCHRATKLRTGRWRAWTDAEVDQFLNRAPPHMQLACLVGLHGLRGSDAARITWAAYRRGRITYTPAKTDGETPQPLDIAVHPRLAAALEAVPPGARRALTILTQVDGTAWPTALHLQTEASKAIRAAGLKGVVWHGLRKTAGRWLAEAGCSDAEIQAILGHRTRQMVEAYTADAERQRAATRAMTKLKKRWKER